VYRGSQGEQGVRVFSGASLLFSVLKPYEVAGNLIVVVFALVYAFFRMRSGKVNMEISYEEA